MNNIYLIKYKYTLELFGEKKKDCYRFGCQIVAWEP